MRVMDPGVQQELGGRREREGKVRVLWRPDRDVSAASVIS